MVAGDCVVLLAGGAVRFLDAQSPTLALLPSLSSPFLIRNVLAVVPDATVSPATHFAVIKNKAVALFSVSRTELCFKAAVSCTSDTPIAAALCANVLVMADKQSYKLLSLPSHPLQSAAQYPKVSPTILFPIDASLMTPCILPIPNGPSPEFLLTNGPIGLFINAKGEPIRGM